MKKTIVSILLLSFLNATHTEHIATNPIGALLHGIFNKTEEVVAPEETVTSAMGKLGSAISYASGVVGTELYNFGGLCAKQAWNTTSAVVTYCAQQGYKASIYCGKQAWKGTTYTAAQTYKHALVPATKKTVELGKQGSSAMYKHLLVPAALAAKAAASKTAQYAGEKAREGATIVKDAAVKKANEYPKTTAALLVGIPTYLIVQEKLRTAGERLARKVDKANLKNAQVTLRDRLAWAFGFGGTSQLENIKIENIWQSLYLIRNGYTFPSVD